MSLARPGLPALFYCDAYTFLSWLLFISLLMQSKQSPQWSWITDLDLSRLESVAKMLQR